MPWSLTFPSQSNTPLHDLLIPWFPLYQHSSLPSISTVLFPLFKIPWFSPTLVHAHNHLPSWWLSTAGEKDKILRTKKIKTHSLQYQLDTQNCNQGYIHSFIHSFTSSFTYDSIFSSIIFIEPQPWARHSNILINKFKSLLPDRQMIDKWRGVVGAGERERRQIYNNFSNWQNTRRKVKWGKETEWLGWIFRKGSLTRLCYTEVWERHMYILGRVAQQKQQ